MPATPNTSIILSGLQRELLAATQAIYAALQAATQSGDERLTARQRGVRAVDRIQRAVDAYDAVQATIDAVQEGA